MTLSIILLVMISYTYLGVSIFILTKTPMRMEIFAVVLAHIIFVFILSFASLMMNGSLIKKAKFLLKRFYVGVWIAIISMVLCLILGIFIILVLQRWIYFGYDFVIKKITKYSFYYLQYFFS